jgi:hypothetical protein
MRLGAYACTLKPGTLAHKLYGRDDVSERHRHRYEVNNEYRKRFEEAGLTASGINTDLGLVEILELNGHPHFIGCQFHPEFQSKPFQAHPLFVGFIGAALENRIRKGEAAKAIGHPPVERKPDAAVADRRALEPSQTTPGVRGTDEGGTSPSPFVGRA